MFTIGAKQYETRALSPEIRASWRKYLIAIAVKPMDALYARIKHLPESVQLAMMREAVHLPVEPTEDAIKDAAYTSRGVTMLAWLLTEPRADFPELANSITDKNKGSIIHQINDSNKTMSAAEAASFLKKVRETCQHSQEQCSQAHTTPQTPGQSADGPSQAGAVG